MTITKVEGGNAAPPLLEQEMVQVQPKRARRYVFASPEMDVAKRLVDCVIAQYRRCERVSCRCATGPQHGPYFL